MATTKTISVRLPLDVIKNIENICKQRNINKNKLLQEIISSEGIVNVNSFNDGGKLDTLPEIVEDVLIGLGGVAVGTVVYHVMKKNLPKTWSEDKIEMVSVLSSIVGGLGTTWGLHKLNKKS